MLLGKLRFRGRVRENAPTIPMRIFGAGGELPEVEAVVAAGDVTVAYQPIVDVERAEVFAYEALARCRCPAYPDPPSLIEAARAQGVLGKLGRYLRLTAAAGCPDTPLFLNVDPAEFDDGEILRDDEPAISHGPGAYLELTEASPTTHYRSLTSSLRELRARGAHLVLDDVGAGYSNLRNLADLEPDLVKLDRELVVGLTAGSRPLTLVRGLIALCADLGCEVLAEGVETVEELDALRSVGVRLVQGYLLGRPAPAPEVSDLRVLLGLADDDDTRPVPLPVRSRA
jgi:EAL domain-containing protein (putative c-di-GMP-specific phosphodiesterase class I)